MPLKISIGLSEKRGLPDFGSVGASCGVELEVDSGLLQGDLDAFHRHVRNAYIACRRAVQDELARHQPAAVAANGNVTIQSQTASPSSAPNGNGRANQANGTGPSEKQRTYLRQLAGQIDGLGVRKLDAVSMRMFGKPVAAISGFQASSLIDTLKAVKAGEIDLDAALNGAMK